MKLSIVVTHYNEPWEVCKPLFDSIAIQRGIDFKDIEVIVINDGDENPLWDNLGLPCEHYCLTQKHGGVSTARNLGIDTAKGDYVMFCDCDDRFCNVYGLKMLFAKMSEGFDVISSVFIEEHNLNGNFEIVSREKDVTFIHGKAFKRAYLIDNDIRFNPDLTIDEDGYFVCLAMSLTESKAEIGMPFYTWVWREGSVANKSDSSWTLKTYPHLMKMRDALCNEMKRRGKEDLYRDFVVKTICDSFFDTFGSLWNDPKNAEYIKAAEKAMKVFYLSHRNEYRRCPVKRIAELYTVSRMTAWSRGEFIETMTLKEFLTHLLSVR